MRTADVGAEAMMARRVGFARWRSEVASGGNRYDDELATGLRALGFDLREYEVTGPWPLPEPGDRRRLAELLTTERDWLIDNIVGSAAPEVIRAATSAGRRVTMLMHYFPADERNLSTSERERLSATEAEAVSAATSHRGEQRLDGAGGVQALRPPRRDRRRARGGTGPPGHRLVIGWRSADAAVAGQADTHQGPAHLRRQRSPDCSISAGPPGWWGRTAWTQT